MFDVLRRRTPLFWVPIGIFVLVAIVYGPAMLYGFSPIDDSYLLYGNLAIRGITLANLKTIFTTFDPELFIPFTLLSYQINYMWSGLAPWSYHAVNVLLHAANASLVFMLLLQLFRHRTLAAALAILFAVHPLHTEAVVWIAGRKDLLSAFFYFLSIIFYIRFLRGSREGYFAALLFGLAALLSKAMAMTLPAVLLLVTLQIQRHTSFKRLVRELLPFVAFSALFVGIAILGKERVLSGSTPLQTLLLAGKSSMFYIQKLFVPVRLSVFYPYEGSIHILRPDLLLSALAVAVIGFAAWFLRHRVPLLSFGIMWYFVTLAPSFPNTHKGDEVYFAVDRYAYLPSVGILLIIVLFVVALLDRRPRLVRTASGVLGIAVLAALTMHQRSYWNASERLIAHALTLYPESIGARTDLARMYREAGRGGESLALIQDGLARGDNVHLRLALGSLYARAGTIAEAIEEFNHAMQLDPLHPGPLFALGSLQEQMGDLDAAFEQFTKAVSLDPSFVVARVRRGRILLQRGRKAEAEGEFHEALEWNPSSMEAHASLGLLLFRRQSKVEAEVHLQKALALDPYQIDVLLALAHLNLEKGRHGRALEDVKKVLSIDQRHPEALALKARIQKQGGHP